MKKTKTSESLPIDCWCNIIQFLGSSKDFFSLVKVVKGLYSYIQRIYPSCTKNVTFKLKTFPLRSQSDHISNVLISFRCSKSPDLQLQSIGCSSVEGLVIRTLQKFKNLLQFKYQLNLIYFDVWRGRVKTSSYSDYKEKDNVCKIVLMKKNSDNIPLKRLSLQTILGNINLSQNFPKLESLELIRINRSYSHYEENRQEKSNLYVEWKYLPMLNSVKLYGWKLTSSFGEHFSVNHLTLGSCETFEKELTMCKQVESLELQDSSISFYEKCGNVENIQKLKVLKGGLIRRNYVWENKNIRRQSDEPFHLAYSLNKFKTNLHELIIRRDYLPLPKNEKDKNKYNRWTIPSGTLPGTSLKVTNFINLRRLELHNLEFKVQIFGCPNIESLCLSQCKSIEFETADHGFSLAKEIIIVSCTDNRKEKTPISIDKAESLTNLKISNSNIEVDCLGNCPKLKTVHFFPSKYCTIENLPNLNTFTAEVKNETSSLNILEQIQILHDKEGEDFYLERFKLICSNTICLMLDHEFSRRILDFEVKTFKDLRFDGEDSTSLKTIKVSKGNRKHSLVEIRNHPKLEKCYISHAKNVTLLNIPLLFHLEIGFLNRVSTDKYVKNSLKSIRVKQYEKLLVLNNFQKLENCYLERVKGAVIKNNPILKNIEILKWGSDKIEIMDCELLEKVKVERCKEITQAYGTLTVKNLPSCKEVHTVNVRSYCFENCTGMFNGR